MKDFNLQVTLGL